MSQYAVAKALGIPRSTYGQVELGERPLRIEMAAALAKLFGCTIDELFYGDNGPDSSPDDPGGEARE
jgi:DNA-binding XRE family transcriptional regulator